MSFPKKGSSFPGRGRGGRQPGNGTSSDAAEFSAAIAAALRRELGSTNAAIKTAATWTNTNDRTVKNWFAGRSTPSGLHLVALARHSDEVLYLVLLTADRRDLLTASRLNAARAKLRELLMLLEAVADDDERAGQQP